jgi:hypothetical protein
MCAGPGPGALCIVLKENLQNVTGISDFPPNRNRNLIQGSPIPIPIPIRS